VAKQRYYHTYYASHHQREEYVNAGYSGCERPADD
jgi:hypothetical protein